MYAVTRRPLTAAEAAAVRGRVAGCRAAVGSSAAALAVLAAVDAAAAVYLRDPGPCLGGPLVFAHFIGFAFLGRLVTSWQDAGRLRRADWAEELRVAPRAAAAIPDWGSWLVLDLGGGRLVALDGTRLPPQGYSLPAVFTLVRTDPGGGTILFTPAGRSVVLVRQEKELRELVRSVAARRRVRARLAAGTPFPGGIDDLPAALARLAADDPPESPAEPAGPGWAVAQAGLEERLDRRFGPGWLAGVAGDLPRPTPATVAAAVHAALPDAAPRPANAPRRRAFHDIREGLAAIGVDRAAVVPAARLDALFPARGRRRAWERFRRASGTTLPAVPTDPPALACAAAAVGLLAGAAAAGAFWVNSERVIDWLIFAHDGGLGAGSLFTCCGLPAVLVGLPAGGAWAGYAAAVGLHLARTRFAFPPGVATVADLVRAVADQAWLPPAPPPRPPLEDVEAAVREHWPADG